MKPNRVALIIRDPHNQWEGLRSSLGLSIEMIETDMFVLGEVRIPGERVDGYKENLEYLIEELECKAYTDNNENVEKWGFFDYITLDDMAKKLPGYDLIIPF